jgi:hypothetical protein
MTFLSAKRIAENLRPFSYYSCSFRARWQPKISLSKRPHFPVALWLIGAGVLGLVLAYGIMRSQRRTPAERRITGDATKDLYKRENRNS